MKEIYNNNIYMEPSSCLLVQCYFFPFHLHSLQLSILSRPFSCTIWRGEIKFSSNLRYECCVIVVCTLYENLLTYNFLISPIHCYWKMLVLMWGFYRDNTSHYFIKMYVLIFTRAFPINEIIRYRNYADIVNSKQWIIK